MELSFDFYSRKKVYKFCNKCYGSDPVVLICIGNWHFTYKETINKKGARNNKGEFEKNKNKNQRYIKI